MPASDPTAKTSDTPKIAVSYRRSDSKAAVTLICNHLSDSFGSDKVFRDLDSIRTGTNFRRAIEDAFRECDVVLAVIGDDWAGPKPDGTTRIHAPNDFVRIEIESAFLFEKPIMPVLLDGACMPEPAHLPESIKKLADLQAVDIDTGRRFRYDANRLVDDIKLVIAIKAEEEAREAEKAAELARKAEEQARTAREAEQAAEQARVARVQREAVKTAGNPPPPPAQPPPQTEPVKEPAEPWYARYLNLHKPSEPQASVAPPPSAVSSAPSLETAATHDESTSTDAEGRILFQCPHCKSQLRTRSGGAGTAGPCPKCGQRVTAPGTATEQQPTPAPSPGRFKSAEPTLVEGEDLDVPTWMRLRRKLIVGSGRPTPEPPKPASPSPAPAEVPAAQPAAPATSKPPVSFRDLKVGRNDPCPCGSSRKFKNCCGRMDGPKTPATPGSTSAAHTSPAAPPPAPKEAPTIAVPPKKETIRITLRARPGNTPPPP